MNVLGVCTPNMEFVFVLPGWEGSAHDGRVLRDAISRLNGLKVPQDPGYTNCEGFLAPYRGHRYHLKEWGDQVPTHPKAGGLWKTPFPYLSKLDDIFGVDSANGLASELPEDSIYILKIRSP
uniref:DDE Tnp4 domain-containing protein n=1 Tax=Chenopodium quinoa TaxID=63459 RepID=A0A803NA85_CHEQI